MDNNPNKNNSINRPYLCASVTILVVLLLFSGMPIIKYSQGSDASVDNTDFNTFNTRTKTKDSPVKTLLFVFDDAGTVVGEWYNTIMKSAQTPGRLLNDSNVMVAFYITWDQDQDSLFGVPEGQATLNLDPPPNGPAYSGGTYPNIYNPETKTCDIPQNADLKQFDAVVWLTGLDSKFDKGLTLSATDASNIKMYLNSGGRLWLCSQDVIQDIYGFQDADKNDAMDPTATKQGDLFYDYFRINFVLQDYGTPDTLTGTSISLAAGASYQTSSIMVQDTDYRKFGDWIYSPLTLPQFGYVQEIFNSTPSEYQKTTLKFGEYEQAGIYNYVNALQSDNKLFLDDKLPLYKTVFFSFEFTAISSENERVDLMDKVLKYILNKPPIITITSPAENQNVAGTFPITGTSSDLDGTVKKITLILDNTTKLTELSTNLASWSYDFDSTKYTDGRHQLMVVAGDGTDIKWCRLNFTIGQSAGVNHRPTVTITSPKENSTIRSTVTISGTATDPDDNTQLKKVQIKIDDGDWQDATGTTSWTFTFDTAPYVDELRHRVYVRAYDGQLYSLEILRNVTISGANFPPTARITSPTDEQTISGSFTIRGRAADADGQILSVQVKIDSDDYKNAKKDGGSWAYWVYELNTVDYDDGPHTIYAKSFDNIDYSTEYVVNVTIQNSALPVAQIEASSLNADISTLVILDGTGSSSSGDLSLAYIWSIDSEPSGSHVTLTSTNDSTTAFTPTREGKYTITLVVNDGLLDSETATVNITVTPPSTQKPDIVISDITFKRVNTVVASANVNDTVVIYANIKNIGSAVASNVKVQFYDGDPSLNGSKQIGTPQNIPVIIINGTNSVSMPQTFTTVGNFTIFVIVDKDNTISELRKDNNKLSKNIEVLLTGGGGNSGASNLKISINDISFSTENGGPLGFVTEGDKIKIIAKIYNTKNEEFTGSVSVKFYAGPVSSGNLITSYDEISSIPANSYQDASCTWNTKNGAPLEIYVVVDGGASELDTADNTVHKPIFVLEKSMVGVGSGDTTGAVPGFEVGILLLAICLTFTIKKRWKSKENK